MTNILSLWDAIVDSTAVVAIVAIGIGLMMGIIEAHRAWERLTAVAGILVLLLILPHIMVSLWHSLSMWQQFGIVSLLGLLGIIAWHGGSHNGPKRGGEH